MTWFRSTFGHRFSTQTVRTGAYKRRGKRKRGGFGFLSFAVGWVHHCYPASFYVPNVLNCMIAVLFFVYYSLINENGSLFRRLSEFVVCPRLHYWKHASYCIRSSHRRCVNAVCVWACCLLRPLVFGSWWSILLFCVAVVAVRVRPSADGWQDVQNFASALLPSVACQRAHVDSVRCEWQAMGTPKAAMQHFGSHRCYRNLEALSQHVIMT